MTTARKYTISIDIEVRDQDDFQHFQPNTVTGSAPQLGVEWVSGGDAAALRDFFNFFINWSRMTDHKITSKGVREIVQRALQGGAEVERLRTERDALRDMLARVVTAYEDALEAEYSHRGVNDPLLGEAHDMLEGEDSTDGK